MAQKVLAAMSGGVDSSVAALILKKKDYDVVGVTMCLGVQFEDANISKCCGPQAIRDARRVCDTLRIPHYVMNFSKQLQDSVIRNFIEEYRAGRTPNPCVRCNEYLKFDILLRKARILGFDFLATGHYAKIEKRNGSHVLKRPKDSIKDQTYFLYCIGRECLKSLVFPLADFTKSEVRSIARKAKLPVAGKAESQDICFITEDNYRQFILHAGVNKPGDIIDSLGKVVGRHSGIVNYTIGQRRGLRISAGKPLYVISIDSERNTVTVGDKRELLAKGLLASHVNLLVDKLPAEAFAQIRYSHTPRKCKIERHNGKHMIMFDKPQQAVTPGQSVVLYGDESVLGGGIIEEVLYEHN